MHTHTRTQIGTSCNRAVVLLTPDANLITVVWKLDYFFTATCMFFFTHLSQA